MYVEDIDEYKVKIDNNNFLITTDSIKLVEYILNDSEVTDGNMLEIGPGTGYISIKLLKKFSNITAVEIQKSVYNLLEENLSSNNIPSSKLKLLNEDIREHTGLYDVIVSNPPYFKMNSGKLPDSSVKLISKFEKCLSLHELITSIAKLLKKGGIFYLLYPTNRVEELESKCRNFGLSIITKTTFLKFAIVKGEKK